MPKTQSLQSVGFSGRAPFENCVQCFQSRLTCNLINQPQTSQTHDAILEVRSTATHT